jgi:hypothetical protein
MVFRWRHFVSLSVLVWAGILAGCNQHFAAALSEPKTSDFPIAKPPYAQGNLVIAGAAMPVEVIPKVEEPQSVTYLLQSEHGAILEREAYRFDEKAISLWQAGGELFEPAIPLLIDPIQLESLPPWSGEIMSALDGAASKDVSTKQEARAVVSITSDRLNVVGGPHDAFRVEVELQIDSGRKESPAKRQLTFWFVKRDGIVKRDFAFSSTREPVGK